MLFTGRREREELQTRNQALELRQQELEDTHAFPGPAAVHP